jgi:Flp pilus assembly protein TadD
MHTTIRCMATIVILSCLVSCAGLNLPGSSQSAFETGLGLFNQGKYEDAIPHFVKATEIDPEFGRAYLYLGRSQLNLRRWAEALTPLRTAYRLAPEQTRQEAVQILIDALIGAGGASLAKGNLREAVSLLREAFTLAPESERVKIPLADALLQSGTQLLSQGKASEAVSAFQEVTKLAPTSFQGYLGLARSLWQSGDALKALPAAQSALQLAPNSAEALSVFALLSQLRNP